MGNEHNQNSGQSHHISSYKDHLITLAILVALTALTVGVSVYGGGMGTISVVLALGVASAKALIVAAYFMHLKYDHKMYRFMVYVVVALFIVFMIVLSIDYSNR
jgi:cytochrome c oxidase subunit IV